MPVGPNSVNSPWVSKSVKEAFSSASRLIPQLKVTKEQKLHLEKIAHPSGTLLATNSGMVPCFETLPVQPRTSCFHTVKYARWLEKCCLSNSSVFKGFPRESCFGINFWRFLTHFGNSLLVNAAPLAARFACACVCEGGVSCQ